MYTHRCRGWIFTPLCSYISLPPAPPLAFRNFSSPAISSHRNRYRTRSLSPSSPFRSPNPRGPLQSESHYNGFMSYQLTSPIPGSCVCVIAIREQTGNAFLRCTPFPIIISQPPCIHLACFLFLRRAGVVFGYYGGCGEPVWLIHFDAVDAYIRFGYPWFQRRHIAGCHRSILLNQSVPCLNLRRRRVGTSVQRYRPRRAYL